MADEFDFVDINDYSIKYDGKTKRFLKGFMPRVGWGALSSVAFFAGLAVATVATGGIALGAGLATTAVVATNVATTAVASGAAVQGIYGGIRYRFHHSKAHFQSLGLGDVAKDSAREEKIGEWEELLKTEQSNFAIQNSDGSRMNVTRRELADKIKSTESALGAIATIRRNDEKARDYLKILNDTDQKHYTILNDEGKEEKVSKRKLKRLIKDYEDVAYHGLKYVYELGLDYSQKVKRLSAKAYLTDAEEAALENYYNRLEQIAELTRDVTSDRTEFNPYKKIIVDALHSGCMLGGKNDDQNNQIAVLKREPMQESFKVYSNMFEKAPMAKWQIEQEKRLAQKRKINAEDKEFLALLTKIYSNNKAILGEDIDEAKLSRRTATYGKYFAILSAAKVLLNNKSVSAADKQAINNAGADLVQGIYDNDKAIVVRANADLEKVVAEVNAKLDSMAESRVNARIKAVKAATREATISAKDNIEVYNAKYKESTKILPAAHQLLAADDTDVVSFQAKRDSAINLLIKANNDIDNVDWASLKVAFDELEEERAKLLSRLTAEKSARVETALQQEREIAVDEAKHAVAAFNNVRSGSDYTEEEKICLRIVLKDIRFSDALSKLEVQELRDQTKKLKDLTFVREQSKNAVRAEAEAEKYKTKHKKATAKVTDLVIEKKKLDKDLKQAEEINKQQKEVILRHNGRIADLVEENEDLLDERENLTRDLTRKEQELADAQKKQAKLAEKHRKATIRVRDEKKQLTEVQEELDVVTEGNIWLVKEGSNLTAEVARLERKAADLEAKSAELDESLRKTESKNAALTAGIERANRNATVARKKILSQRAKIADLTAENDSLSADFDTAAYDLMDAESKIEAQEITLSDARTILDGYQKDAARKDERNAKLAKRNQELSDTVKDLEKQIGNHDAELRAALDGKRKLEEELTYAERRNDELSDYAKKIDESAVEDGWKSKETIAKKDEQIDELGHKLGVYEERDNARNAGLAASNLKKKIENIKIHYRQVEVAGGHESEVNAVRHAVAAAENAANLISGGSAEEYNAIKSNLEAVYAEKSATWPGVKMQTIKKQITKRVPIKYPDDDHQV